MKEVHIFMGHTNYYGRLIKGCVDLSRPIDGLIYNPRSAKQCEKAFQKLKRNLVATPILREPNWDVKFHVHIDASTYAISSIMTHPIDHTMEYYLI